jgi:hypothetical protein
LWFALQHEPQKAAAKKWERAHRLIGPAAPGCIEDVLSPLLARDRCVLKSWMPFTGLLDAHQVYLLPRALRTSATITPCLWTS